VRCELFYGCRRESQAFLPNAAAAFLIPPRDSTANLSPKAIRTKRAIIGLYHAQSCECSCERVSIGISLIGTSSFVPFISRHFVIILLSYSSFSIRMRIRLHILSSSRFFPLRFSSSKGKRIKNGRKLGRLTS
jgi:hypothetical protein